MAYIGICMEQPSSNVHVIQLGWFSVFVTMFAVKTNTFPNFSYFTRCHLSPIQFFKRGNVEVETSLKINTNIRYIKAEGFTKHNAQILKR